MLFTSQNLPHKQINGTPMASPTSGLIADVFLQKLEADTIETRKPSFWMRYVMKPSQLSKSADNWTSRTK